MLKEVVIAYGLCHINSNRFSKGKRVNEYYRTGHVSEEVEERRDQIGTGARGDKRRTYRVKDGQVIDHLTGKSASFKDISKGKIELLA